MKCCVHIFLFFFGIGIASAQLQKTIDSLQFQLQNTPKDSKEYVDLLNGLGYQFWVRDSKTSAKYGEEALGIAQNLKYTSGMAMAQRILGVSYWTFGEPKKALESLKESQELYELVSDKVGAANALMNSGMVYADIGEFDRALKIYEQSIEKFRQLDLKRRIATTFTKIGSVLIQQNKLEEAKGYLTNALNMHSDDGYEYGVSEAHNRLGILSLMQNELELGEYHIRKSMEIVVSLNDEDGELSNLIQIGKLYRLQNRYELANSHLLAALETSKQKGLKKYQLRTLKELKLLKRQEGKLQESLEYYDGFIQLKDSIINNEKAKQIAAMEFNNELAEKEAEIELLKETKKTRNIINLSLSIGLLLLSCIAILMLRHQKQREKREIELLKSNEKLTQTELENAQLRQRELEQELDFKNKELTSYTLNFTQKNELFGELLEKIESLQSATPSKQSKILNELRKKIKSHTNLNRDWEDFKRYFEEVHKGFYTTLKEKHPDLSSNDLKICSLARLNLSIKETAGVMGISPESAKTARYRLRKKLDLPPETELLDYLLELEQ
ncbi:tetratricopeptide repeat protein [Flagellimonas sp. S174]|uniref:tetratricopeptide repeat protein n=1 Tax=Flagellimonas sp. S174 TaxID=3410790 RepID=UPI003BF46755